MSESQTVATRCAACGADLPAEGAPCPACAVADPPPDPVALCEAVLEERAAARSALWMRAAAAGIYALVSAACVYGAYGFFAKEDAAIYDWIFGSFGVGLALIALLGVKESLFPSDWTPE